MSIFHRVNDADYHILLHGDGHNFPLMLLHGFTGAGQVWEHVMGALGKAFKSVAPDLLGHGETRVPDNPARYAIERAADDLMVLAARLDCLPMALHGYSLGGRLALYLALNYPDAIRSLSLESASPGLADAEARLQRQLADDRLAARIESDGLNWFADYWQAISLFESQKLLPSEVLEAQRERRLRANSHGLANSLRGMGTGVQPPLWDELGRLRMPVLLLTGGLDTKFCQIAEQMRARIPLAEWQTVPDVGHAVYLEAPNAWLSAVTDFHRRYL
jgi:2-succinyl-6-hydroxy-2,4-cyclohexadiene-1-carboxylate synthase